jgi:cytochrome P450
VNGSNPAFSLDARLWRDPHAVFAELRGLGAVHLVQMPNGASRYAIVRYSECRAALRDPRFVSSAVAAGFEDHTSRPRRARILRSMMITQDGIDHDRLRTSVRPLFDASLIQACTSGVGSEVQQLISNMRPDAIDVVSEVAVPLSISILRRLLGVTGEAGSGLFAGLDDLAAGPGRSVAELLRTVHRLVTAPGEAVHPDGLIDWASCQVKTGTLTVDEAISMIVLILYAGHVTTVLALSYSVFHLMQSPAVVTELSQNDPADSATAVVNETLRLESPIFPGLWRRTTTDVELGHVRIPAQSSVLIAVASANRDERRFSDPDVFAPLRRRRGHLSYGHGAHYCLGSGLANQALTNILREFFASRCLQRAHVIENGITWTNTERRGLARLLVAFFDHDVIDEGVP